MNYVNKNITKHDFFFKVYKANITDLQMLGNGFCEFVHLFENSLLKILAQLYMKTIVNMNQTEV